MDPSQKALLPSRAGAASGLGKVVCSTRLAILSAGALALLGGVIALSVGATLDPRPNPPTTLRVSALLPPYGVVNMSQSSRGGPVTISVALAGVPASTSATGSPVQHGFHVHGVSDLGNNCANAGPHFNVLNVTHGAPNNATRHTGDLGNLVADAAGSITATFTDAVISLRAADATCVVNKPVVLHADQDDFGLGGAPTSKTTGNAGARLACGILAAA